MNTSSEHPLPATTTDSTTARLSLVDAHAIAEDAQHRLLHDIPG